MEEKIKLLRDIKSGAKNPTLANILAATDTEVLASEAVKNQRRSVQATNESLDEELKRMDELIESRKLQNEKLEGALIRLQEIDPAQQANPIDLIPLNILVKQLSTTRLVTFDPDNDPSRVTMLLNRLLEVSSIGQQLVVPSDSKIVQYLINEGLVQHQPASQNMLRIRLM